MSRGGFIFGALNRGGYPHCGTYLCAPATGADRTALFFSASVPPFVCPHRIDGPSPRFRRAIQNELLARTAASYTRNAPPAFLRPRRARPRAIFTQNFTADLAFFAKTAYRY